MMNIDREIAELKEKWVPLDDYGGWYEISNYGRVRSWKHKNGRRKIPLILAESVTDKGYVQYHLWHDGNRMVISAHRAVLRHFVGPCPKKHTTAHNNGNRRDNRLSNLRWDTVPNNINDRWKHGTMTVGEKTNSAKLTEKQVKTIRRLSETGMKNNTIAKCCLVSPSTIGRIVNRRTWKHI